MQGYRVRPATLEDVGPVARMIAEGDVHDYGEVTFFESDLVDFLHRPRLDMAEDTWVFEDEHGKPAAFGWVWVRTENEHVVVMGVVHPEHRGRGLGSTVAQLMEDRARRIVAGRPEGAETVVTSAIAATDPSARALLEARGYREARIFWRMRRILDAPVEREADPAGVAVRPADPATDAEPMHRVIEEAFLDHFRPRYEPYDEWLERNLRHPGRLVWFLAVMEGEVVGALTGSIEEGKAHVDQIGVLREARRRGIGEQLLREAFAAFANADARLVELDVDSENRTGATALYERVGMSLALSYVFYDKTI
ncbi:MAG: GNAT family N-acetyltransferase [Actinomycetota bacterium]